MSEAIFLACDLSGIQRYVLAVKSEGKAQAKRLRVRSFLLELYEHAALTTVNRPLRRRARRCSNVERRRFPRAAAA